MQGQESPFIHNLMRIYSKIIYQTQVVFLQYDHIFIEAANNYFLFYPDFCILLFSVSRSNTQ